MNNTFTATELLTYANLQIAAETLYGKLKDPAGNPNDLTANGEAKLTVENLKDGNDHSSKFSETQAKEFAQNWTIISHIANTASGFSGTLFKNKNGELVISFSKRRVGNLLPTRFNEFSGKLTNCFDCIL